MHRIIRRPFQMKYSLTDFKCFMVDKTGKTDPERRPSPDDGPEK